MVSTADEVSVPSHQKHLSHASMESPPFADRHVYQHWYNVFTATIPSTLIAAINLSPLSLQGSGSHAPTKGSARFGFEFVAIGAAEAALLIRQSEISSHSVTPASPTHLFTALFLIDMRGRSGCAFWD